MKIADRTPFRSESGGIDIVGRAQGTLKYGLSWYARLQAQDVVIAVLEKVLGPNYVLMRNVTLPNTDIDLPLVLIGPPGIYLINVTHERGVYRARDDEWGKVANGKFVPAGINHIQRTAKLGRVLQIYLDRAGYKDKLVVDPILMAADPGMHIESVRPAVRIVMSDALERFAISMNQARAVQDNDTVKAIAQVIVNGPKKEAAAAPFVESPAEPLPVSNPSSPQNANETLFNPVPQPETTQPFASDSFDFSFDFSEPEQQAASPQKTPPYQSAAAPKRSNQNTALKNNNNVTQVQRNSTSPENQFEQFSFQESESPDRAFSAGDFMENRSQETELHAIDQQAGTPTVQFTDLTEIVQPAAPVPTDRPAADNKPTAPAIKKRRFLGMSIAQLAILGGIFLCWFCAIAAFAIYITQQF